MTVDETPSEFRTVWAVSSGDYSNYHVVACFEREADAERFANNGDDQSYDDRRVEEMKLVTSLGTPRRHVSLAEFLERDGSPHYSGGDHEVDWWPELDEPLGEQAYTTVVAAGFKGEHVFVSVQSYDVPRARKVFSEMRAQALAEYDVLVERERVASAARMAEFEERHRANKQG